MEAYGGFEKISWAELSSDFSSKVSEVNSHSDAFFKKNAKHFISM